MKGKHLTIILFLLIILITCFLYGKKSYINYILFNRQLLYYPRNYGIHLHKLSVCGEVKPNEPLGLLKTYLYVRDNMSVMVKKITCKFDPYLDITPLILKRKPVRDPYLNESYCLVAFKLYGPKYEGFYLCLPCEVFYEYNPPRSRPVDRTRRRI